MKTLLRKIGVALLCVLALLVFLNVASVAFFGLATIVNYENAEMEGFWKTRDLNAPGLEKFLVDGVLVSVDVKGPGGMPYALRVWAVSRSPGAAFVVERVEFRDLNLDLPAQGDDERVAIDKEVLPSKGQETMPLFSGTWFRRNVLQDSRLAEIAKNNGGLDATVWIKLFNAGKIVDAKIEVHFDQRVKWMIAFPT